MANQAGDPTLSMLSEKSRRVRGKDAQSMNLEAAQAVAEAVRTTLGPRGMDKMLVDETGNVVVTNDGVTVLGEMNVDHPAADMVVEVAQSQEQEVGDGTTTAVILTSALLSEAEDLLEQDVHPTTITAGFDRVKERIEKTLSAIAIEVDADDIETLEAIASTAMTGKGVESAREHLVALAVEAVRRAAREDGQVDREAVSITTFTGGDVSESRFVEGVTIDQTPVEDAMPTSMADADILLYEGAIESADLEVDSETTVSNFDEAVEFRERERSVLQDDVEEVLATGADVVVTEGGVDDDASALFADEGVTVLRRVDDADRRQIETATDATPVFDLESATPADLGHAGSVDLERIRMEHWRAGARPEETMVFSDVPGGDAGSILLRGGTDHALEEIERALEDGLDVLVAAVEEGAILPGAGAAEIEVSLALETEANAVEGREQLAVEAFADAVERLPRTLAENAGHSPIDSVVALRRRHADGDRTVGIDVESGEPIDAFDAGVVEPRRVKQTAIGAAIEATNTVLRIDDVISAGDLTSSGGEESG
ncbi:MAG: thermosome subunit alpha [Halodesulfurarchaeum sp.]